MICKVVLEAMVGKEGKDSGKGRLPMEAELMAKLLLWATGSQSCPRNLWKTV